MYFGERLLLTDSPMVLDANPRPSGRWPRRKKDDLAIEESPLTEREVHASLTKFVMPWKKNELKRINYPWKSGGGKTFVSKKDFKKNNDVKGLELLLNTSS
jgi:hypothetical protein